MLLTKEAKMVCEIIDPEEKETIATKILFALPEWFGLPESTRTYIEESKAMPFWAAFWNGHPAGFLALKETSQATAEIFVMGVLPDFHGMGLGTELYFTFEENARRRGYLYAQVKTVQMGRYPSYDKTNRFYMTMGFAELECFPTLWDAWNPCQIYVKYIGG